jgi:hypothetical protein
MAMNLKAEEVGLPTGTVARASGPWSSTDRISDCHCGQVIGSIMWRYRLRGRTMSLGLVESQAFVAA